MTIATANHFLVKCAPCGCVWSLMTLPIAVTAAAKLTRRARCPSCDSRSAQHFLANEADATAWMQAQASAVAQVGS